MKIASACNTMLQLLSIAATTTLLSAPLQAQMESEFNWTPGGISSQWTDPTNWNNQKEGDVAASTPGGPEAVVNIGAGSSAFFNNGGGGILLLNLGNGARLDIESGFLSFGERTAARPFSIQNSGVLNVVGSSARIELRDQVANFSTASINLDDGGRISIVDGDTTINTSNLDTGNGSITLGTGSQITGSGGGTLSFVKQTIEGQGNIGNNSIGLNFDADTIVDANVAGGTLTVDAVNSLAAVNQGVIRATNGGILSLRGPITNTGGLIEAQDGSEVDLGNTFDITGGILRRSETGTFTSSGSGRLSNLTLDNIDLTVGNARNLSLDGAINNLGDILVNNTNSGTDIQIDTATSLTGGGTVTLGGTSDNSRIADDNGGGVLTNVDNTIRGRGQVGVGQVRIVNESGGTIDANDSTGSLRLGPVSGVAVVNRGLLRSSNGGNLVFGAGEYDNVGGTIDIQDGSVATLNNGSNITGGTVQNLGTGSFDMAITGSFTDLTTRGTIDVDNAENLRLTGTINNLGDILVNNTNSGTDIQIDTATSLTGGGTVTLGGTSNNSRIADDNGGGVLTNVDNTIRGRGQVGVGQVLIINDAGGTIDGDDSMGALTLNSESTGASVNRGLITASNGGSVVISGGDFDNSSGLIEPQRDSSVTVGGSSVFTGGTFNATDGSTIRFSGSGRVVGATLQSNGTGKYEAISGTGVLEDVANESSITVTNAANLGLVGTINNSGDIAVDNSNSGTDIQIDAATSLTGGGTVTLGGSSNNSRITDDNGGGVLTNVDNTIRGRGQVGSGRVRIVNESGGTIDANDSTGSLQLGSASGSALVNRGLLTASDGGNLVLGAGEYDNVGGTIDIQDGSTITFNAGSNITGGTVQNLGTGSFDMAITGSFTDLTTIGTININNADNLRLTGTINNLGDILVNNSNSATDLQIDTTASLTGGGTVTLGGTSDNSRIADDNGGGVLTNVDNTIRGRGRVGDGLVQIINEASGTIDANDSTGSLQLRPVLGAAMVNRGLLRSSNGGNLVFGAGEYDNVGGTIDIQDGSVATLNSGSNITGGTVQNLGTGSFDIAITGSFTDLTTRGTIDVGNAENLRLTGTINNLGDISIINSNSTTDLQIDTTASLTGGGTVTLGGTSGNSRIADDNGGGVLTNVDNTIQGFGSVGSNLVQIVNQAGGTIHANQLNQTLVVDSADATFDNAGLLMASDGGTLQVTDTLLNTGTLAVNTGGEFNVLGDLVTTGTINYELESLSSFEGIQVNGAATLGGDVSVGTSLSFTPTIGETFELLFADGGIIGEFDSNALSDLENGLKYDIQYTANTAILGVSLLGDFDDDGDVDADDIDFFIGNIGSPATGSLAQLDLDDTGTIDLADHELHVEQLVQTSNGLRGTFLGDANLDGTVDVLGDAFILVSSLGGSGGFADGDFNADGNINVLGDAFALVGNLGRSNSPSSFSPSSLLATSAVPEPGSLTFLALVGITAGLRRRKI